MRTRTIAAVLAALGLVLTACGGGGGSGGTPLKITLIQGLAGEEFYETMACGAKEMAKELGVTLDVQGPQKFDPTLQTPIVNSVTASRPAAILIAPTDGTAMIAPLRQAQSAGSRVILVDTVVKDDSIGQSRISTDNVKAGAEAAKALASQISDKGKVLLVSTDPGVSTMDARIKGFEDEIKSHPGIHYLGVQYSHNDVQQAGSIVNAALAKDPDLAGVFAGNLNSATGAGSALRQAGRAASVKMVGFDAGPAQVKQLQDGVVQALIAQQPGVIGAQGVAQAHNTLTGKPVDKQIQTGTVVVTKDNASDPNIAKYLYKGGC